MSFSPVFLFLPVYVFGFVIFVIKVTSFAFCAVRQHNKAVPVLLGLAGSSRWVHQAGWCHCWSQPGAGALKQESHSIIW